MKERGDLKGSRVSEKRKACITMRKAPFLRMWANSSELASGSWNATESEFCTNNESMSDLEMKSELHKVQTKGTLHSQDNIDETRVGEGTQGNLKK